MEKAGMTLEGTARQAAIKWGRYEDLVSYGILREDWLGG
jgi:RimJ/RimL family protein N-acetyltransferase